MLRFSNIEDAYLADRCIRPLCFAALGDEYYGLQMSEIEMNGDKRDRKFQLGLQGTCTLIHYIDCYFVLFTRHQIALIPNESPQKFQERLGLIYILMDDGRDSTNLPLNTLLFAFDGVDRDDEDDFVVGVVERSMMTEFMRRQFFPVSRGLTGRVGDKAICAGFPSHRQQVLMEIGGLRLDPQCKCGVVQSRSTSSTGTVTYENDNEPLDGFSGGLVLVTRLDPNLITPNVGFIAFIDGIIQRAGNGYIRYLAIERVLDKIDKRTFAKAKT